MRKIVRNVGWSNDFERTHTVRLCNLLILVVTPTIVLEIAALDSIIVRIKSQSPSWQMSLEPISDPIQ